jgi:hypothetical protein
MAKAIREVTVTLLIPAKNNITTSKADKTVPKINF